MARPIHGALRRQRRLRTLEERGLPVGTPRRGARPVVKTVRDAQEECRGHTSCERPHPTGGEVARIARSIACTCPRQGGSMLHREARCRVSECAGSLLQACGCRALGHDSRDLPHVQASTPRPPTATNTADASGTPFRTSRYALRASRAFALSTTNSSVPSSHLTMHPHHGLPIQVTQVADVGADDLDVAQAGPHHRVDDGASRQSRTVAVSMESTIRIAWERVRASRLYVRGRPAPRDGARRGTPTRRQTPARCFGMRAGSAGSGPTRP